MPWAQTLTVGEVLSSVSGFPVVLQQLQRSFVTSSNPRRVTAAISERRLQNLVGAIAVCRQSVSSSRSKQRDAAYNRFVGFINEMGADAHQARDAHCLAYLDEFSQRGTYEVDGRARCSPDTMDNQITFLRKAIEMYDGRVGPYCPLTGQGKPVRSVCAESVSLKVRPQVCLLLCR